MTADDEPPIEDGASDETRVGARTVTDEEFEAVLEESIEHHRAILRELAKR